MTIFLGRIFLFAAAACMWAGSAAADYVFVFYDEGTTAGVYDTETLELAGEPEVGANVQQVFGVPDAADPTRFVKIYIVNDDAVRVLNPAPPFETISTRNLSGEVVRGGAPAVLSPDGRWLLVPNGNMLSIFHARTSRDFFFGEFDYGRDDMSRDRVITSLAVEPMDERAYLSLANSNELHVVSLGTAAPRRLSGGPALPEVPIALAAAPSGADLYAVTSEGLHDVDSCMVGSSGDPACDTIEIAVGETPAFLDFHGGDPLNRLIVTHGNTISLPTIATFTLEFGARARFAADKLLAPTQDRLFLLNRADKQIFEHVIGENDFGMLQDPRTQAALSPSAIDMELDLAAQNLFVLNADELLRFSADAASFAAEADLTRAPTGFSVLSTTGGTLDALSVYGGDKQETDLSGSIPRPIAVRATDADGIPVFGAEVAFSSEQSGVSLAPSTAVTNRFGIAMTRATASRSGAFSVRAKAEGGGETDFAFNEGPVGRGALTVLSGDFQAALENTALPRRIELRIAGSGVRMPYSTFTIKPSNDSVECPEDAQSTPEGILVFQCSSKEGDSIGAATPTRIEVRDDSGRALAERLTVQTIRREDQAMLLPGNFQRTTEGPIRGAAGQTIEDGVEMSLLLLNGNPPWTPIAVEFDVANDDITPIPHIAPSDRQGMIRADLKLGCRPSTGRFTATLNSPELAEIEEFEYEIVRGPMHSIAQSGGNHQSGAPGERLPVALLAVIADSCGNPFGNVPVTWRVEPEDAATLDRPRSMSNSRGQVSTFVRLGSRPGRFSVILSASGDDGVISTTFSLTVAGPEPPPGVSAAFVNGASFIPGSGWTPGSVGSIFGAGLLSGIEGVVVAEGLPFPTELRGIRVLVDGEPAPIFSVSNAGGQEQINIQVPFSTPAPAESVAVVVENSGSSIPFTGPQTFVAHPGIFGYALPGADDRFAAALHADYSLAGTENPARPEEIIQLYFTGGGPIDPSVPTNAATASLAETAHPVTVTLDGVAQATSGDFLGSFYAPGLAAVYQVNFRVGADTPDGNRQIRIEQNSVQSQALLLPVRR